MPFRLVGGRFIDRPDSEHNWVEHKLDNTADAMRENPRDPDTVVEAEAMIVIYFGDFVKLE